MGKDDGNSDNEDDKEFERKESRKKKKGDEIDPFADTTKKRKRGKLKRSKKADPQDWELQDFPKMEDRDMVQASVDPERLAEMQMKAKQAVLAAKSEDSKDFARKWRLNFSIVGVENITGTPIEVFLAISVANTTERVIKKTGKIKSKFHYTRAYRINPESHKKFKSEELVYNKSYELSYEECRRKEIVVDMWATSKYNFNTLLGTAAKTFYDLGNTSIYQQLAVLQAGDENERVIGYVMVKCVFTEIMTFKIIATNWQFTLRPELEATANPEEPKKMRIGIPTEAGAGNDTFETPLITGPRYLWATAGEFKYVGTDVSLANEAIIVTVCTKDAIQGRAVVSLASAGDYPIAQGVLKKITRTPTEYVQGRVSGSLQLTKRSFLLKPGVIDTEGGIVPPTQPADTLITYFLSPKIQYLIVELFSADGLPIADQDTGTSNPFARVKYDGMVQQTNCVMATLSPVFAHTFYIPVRVPDEAIRTELDHYENLLPIEMKSKGFLEVELWHWDSVPTEFLGTVKVDLMKTRFGDRGLRAICDKVTKAKSLMNDVNAQGEEDKDGDISMGIHPGLTKKHETRILEIRREKIQGSWLHSPVKSTVSLDCYFVPDFPDEFRYLAQDGEFDDKDGAKVSKFQKSFDLFQDQIIPFAEAYAAWFPDSVQDRRFLHKFKDSGGIEVPLNKLIVPLALPESLEKPQAVLHWARCFEFVVPPRQRSRGEMSNWNTVDTMLSLRKGTVQDHAVLLACALKGLQKDAWVCKGTMQEGREHAWVLTREALGVCTFWETTTGCKYHLGARWFDDPRHQDSTKEAVQERWKNRKVNNKWMELAGKRVLLTRAQHISYMDDLTKLPISPWKELGTKENVVCLPYDTIEVVFNDKQLYANMTNGNPASIYYDMEDDPKSWCPLLIEEHQEIIKMSKCAELPVGPTVSDYTAQKMADSMEQEIKECIRMVRMRTGFESYFVNDALLEETLAKYLDWMEAESRLDSDWCYDSQDKQRPPWSVQSPFNNFDYVQECREGWSTHWKNKAQLDMDKTQLPVKPNHVLSGIPLHFSCCDIKEIRYYLMNCAPIQEYLNIPKDEPLFFVSCKIYALPGSVSSTWIFLGAQVPLPQDVIMELHLRDMEEQANEERPDSDEETAPKRVTKRKARESLGVSVMRIRGV